MRLLYCDTPGAGHLLTIYNAGGSRWEEKLLLPRVVLFRSQEHLLFVPLCEKEVIQCVYWASFVNEYRGQFGEERQGEKFGENKQAPVVCEHASVCGRW